jgi:DNA-binding transcriptional MerR regulator
MEYQIGDFATISRLSIKTLRYYHEIGLLHPTRIDKLTGYRYYNEGSIHRVRTIQQLKALRFSLSEIVDLLNGQPSDEEIQIRMQIKLNELDTEIHQTKAIRERLQNVINKREVLYLNQNRVTEKILPDQFIASIRFKGAFEEFNQKIPFLLGACGNMVNGAPFSLYYDDHPSEDQNDIELCVPVQSALQHETIQCRTLPGGCALSILHEGYYDQISTSYQALVDHYLNQGLMIQYPIREVYWVGGSAHEDDLSGQYLTEIQFMLA